MYPACKRAKGQEGNDKSSDLRTSRPRGSGEKKAVGITAGNTSHHTLRLRVVANAVGWTALCS
eukprot:6742305-Prorocentrum_lima.AAC.1